jgi:hypothetical protein
MNPLKVGETLSTTEASSPMIMRVALTSVN